MYLFYDEEDKDEDEREEKKERVLAVCPRVYYEIVSCKHLFSFNGI